MNRLILAAALAAGCTLASSAPAVAAAKHYDCSKAGNANKAACKNAATNAAAPKATNAEAKAAKADARAKAKAASAEAKAKAKAAKAEAKAQAKTAKSEAKATQTAAAKPKSVPKAVAPRRTAVAAPASVEDRNPAGAIAQCKDGTYSHAKARSGACSRHGGVGTWS
jgi:hypothetical protein